MVPNFFIADDKVCSIHFLPGDFKTCLTDSTQTSHTSHQRKKLNDKAVPTIGLIEGVDENLSKNISFNETRTALNDITNSSKSLMEIDDENINNSTKVIESSPMEVDISPEIFLGESQKISETPLQIMNQKLNGLISECNLNQAVSESNLDMSEIRSFHNEMINLLKVSINETAKPSFVEGKSFFLQELQAWKEKYHQVFEDNKKMQELAENYRNKLRETEKKLLFQQKMESQKIKEKVYEILQPCFTKGQIKKLINPHKTKLMWDAADIASAISLRTVTPKGYKYLRKKNYPLPGLSTLRKRASKIILQEGVITQVLDVMEKKAKA